MAYLPDIDEENGSPKLLKTVAANARLKTALVIMGIVLILAGIAFYSFYSNIETKVEVRLKEKYDKQIVSLEDKIKENNEKYEQELAREKESYKEKLSNADEKHKKEIEKKDNKISELEEEIQVYKVKDKVSFDEIETQIKNVGKLTTVDFHYTYAGTHEDVDNFFGTKIKMNFTKNSFIAQWDGVVALGVDMSKVKITVHETTKTITVSIPKAEIFYHDVDEDSFKVLYQKDNMWNRITVEDVNEFNKKYEQKIYEKIEERRLLEDAYKNAQTTIENILIAVPAVANQYTIGYTTIK